MARGEALPPGEKLLEVKDLHTYFKTRGGLVKAVDGVTFDVGVGASVGIVGESGSGKSMTALSIMRLITPPGFIAGGEILFGDRNLVKLSKGEMRRIRGRRISMVFQEPTAALNPVFTVGRQVAEALLIHRQARRRAARQRALELFKLVGIPAPERRIKEHPHQMSGGMQQRVMIAMALANEPDLLILDEPTTALDVTIQAQILELVKQLRARVKTAVLLITHDFGVIAEMVDHVIVMYGGKVMERGTTMQIIKDPKHPYTRGLLASVPQLGTRGSRLQIIRGAVPNPLRMPPGCPFAPRCPYVMDICRSLPRLTKLEDGREVLCWLYQPNETVSLFYS